MKRNFCFAAAILTGLVLGTQAFADDMNGAQGSLISQPTQDGGSMSQPATPTGMHPCVNIRNACQAANMGKNKHEIWNNCVKLILAGQPVAGVSVDPGDVQSCKSKIMMHKKKGNGLNPAT